MLCLDEIPIQTLSVKFTILLTFKKRVVASNLTPCKFSYAIVCSQLVSIILILRLLNSDGKISALIVYLLFKMFSDSKIKDQSFTFLIYLLVLICRHCRECSFRERKSQRPLTDYFVQIFLQ